MTFSAGASAQALAPATLGGESRSEATTNDLVQVITAKAPPAIGKKTRKLVKASARKSTEKPMALATQNVTQSIAKTPARATFTMEPVRPMNQPTVNQTAQHGSRFSFKTADGKKESVP